MSSYSVKMITRVSFHLAEFSPRFPCFGRSGHWVSRIHSISRTMRPSGKLRDASAISVIWSSNNCSRAKSALASELFSGPIVAALIAVTWSSSSAWS